MYTDYTKSQQHLLTLVDTGSPASFINKKTADILVKSRANINLLSTSETPIDTHYVDYIRRTIKLLVTSIADVSSLGWQINLTKFLVAENRSRFLFGLDLQSAPGVKTNQSRPIPINEISPHLPTQTGGGNSLRSNLKMNSQNRADQKTTECTWYLRTL